MVTVVCVFLYSILFKGVQHVFHRFIAVIVYYETYTVKKCV